jgi:hypothetical protein
MQLDRMLVDLGEIDMRLGEFDGLRRGAAALMKTANDFRIFGNEKRYPVGSLIIPGPNDT